MDTQAKKQLEMTACKVRMGVIEETFQAKSGHPGGSLSVTDLLTYLYFKEMNIDPAQPKMETRDRFVLSKGHTAPALYAVMAQRGYFPEEELKSLRKVGSRLQGHPSMKLLPGIDMSTGSLGQGISAAVGMALGSKYGHKGFRVYTVLGDGELEEGQVWEASMAAAHYGLDNLTVIIDNNGLQIDGANNQVMSLGDLKAKFTAFGFQVLEIDGNDLGQVSEALDAAAEDGKPKCIIAHTVKGKGVSFMENQVGWHGKAPSEEERRQALKELEEES